MRSSYDLASLLSQTRFAPVKLPHVRVGLVTLATIATTLALANSKIPETPILSLETVVGQTLPTENADLRMSMSGQSKSLSSGPGNAANFELKRPIDTDSLEYYSVRQRKTGGGMLLATLILPFESKKPACVLILDTSLREIKVVEPKLTGSTLRDDDVDVDEATGRACLNAPLPSHLVGRGFAIACPTPASISGRKTTTYDDWIGLAVKIRSQKFLDADSFFILATAEFAQLALSIARQVPCAGVVIQEPTLLFQNELLSKIEGLKTSEPEVSFSTAKAELVMQTYVNHFRGLKSPLLLVLVKKSPEEAHTTQLLIPSLIKAEADFRVVSLDGPARVKSDPAISTARNQDEKIFLGFNYHRDPTGQWIDRMLAYFVERAKTKPKPIPYPPSSAKSAKGLSDTTATREQHATDADNP